MWFVDRTLYCRLQGLARLTPCVRVCARAIDDIIKTIGPSLQRHQGCDLLDLNPGAGIWSKALHDAVKPRRHIMLDADAESYKPLLKEAMGRRRNIEIIPQNGFVWSELKKVLTSHIDPYHAQLPRSSEEHPSGTREIPHPERNDMLLVTANVTTYPKRTLWSFDSLATMVLYQLLSSIRTSSYFQRYGCVRMLIWANDENKRPILPRSLLQRKRVAFENELSCDWLHEVAGYDHVDVSYGRRSLRDDWLNIESTAATLRRMEAAKIPVIPGRETEALSAILADQDLRNHQGNLAGHHPPNLKRPFRAELEHLRTQEDNAVNNKEYRRLKYRDNYAQEDSLIYLELLQMKHAALALNDTNSDEFRALDKAFTARVEDLKKNTRNEFGVIKDSYHLFRHNGPEPALLWDRRAYEPLAVNPSTDFYPNQPACLLDIQPKPMDPLFRQSGPQTSRSGDISDLLLRLAYSNITWPVESRAMDTFWPGFSDMASHCPSLRDVTKGGSPMSGQGALALRSMNETHWTELMRAWLKWPFRPSLETMIGRLGEETMRADSEGVVGSQPKSLVQ